MIGIAQIGRYLRGLRREQKGATAVEFALSFPVYLGALFLLFEFGRVAYVQGVVIFAAEEATRFALVNYGATPTEIQAKARSNLLGLETDNLTAILVTDPLDPTDDTRLITIEVQYRYEPVLPVFKLLGAGDKDGAIALTGASRGFLTEEIPGT